MHDFIIVGAGPCGSSLAARLAGASSAPSILLIEAGGPNDDPKNRLASERHLFWATPRGRSLDHGYQTIAQPALGGRRLPYHRGKGLGGSTATNLGLWDYGSKPEMNLFAQLVGDTQWEWEEVKRRMQMIEDFHDHTPSEAERYLHPEAGVHGTKGPVGISSPGKWDPSLFLLLETIGAHGLPLNPDLSSDQCIGFGVPPTTVRNGERVTASTAYLSQKSAHLDIMTDSQVSRVLFEGSKAVGVELLNGTKHFASKEIILCAGAIDTPKLLLLSGVGPMEHLATHDIPLVSEVPHIGTHLMDHPMIRIAALIKHGVVEDYITARARNTKAQKEARSAAHPGDDVAAAGHGYFRLEGVDKYPGFELLEEDMQAHLTDPLTPAYELVCRIAPSPAVPGGYEWNAIIAIMNAQSRGRVFLNSNRPEDPPAIDLNFLSEPYDLRVVSEAVKKVVGLLQGNGVLEIEGPLTPGPRSLEDEDVLAFIRSQLGHLWHAAGTVKMGKTGAGDTCVTPDFKVVGVDSLRVADLSILPIMPSNHPQSTAYLVGEIAAATIIAEHDLGP